MKDARGGTHSLAESVVPLPARHGLIELIGHSAAQVQPLLINDMASRGGGIFVWLRAARWSRAVESPWQGWHSSASLTLAA
jgi:hypothetical protein